MKIRNFTGKTLRIKNKDTGTEQVLETEGHGSIQYSYGPELNIDGIPIFGEREANVVGVPEKEDNTFIVVPLGIRFTKDLWERDDLLVVPIRDFEETSTEIICSFLEK